MRIWLMAGLVVLLLASLATAVPKMFLPLESFDFGFAPQDSKLTHVFWIKSVGEDSLKILKVTPGWGCTQAPLKKQELAVGDSTELEIIYSTGKHRGTTSKSPSISTNEGPPDRRITIKVTTVAQPDSTFPLVINPYRLFVSRADTIEVDESVFKLTNVSDQDLDITVVSQPFGYFQLSLPKAVKAGQVAECKLKVNPQYLTEPFEKSITIELNDAAKTRFTIPVVRRLIGAGAGAKSVPGTTGQQGGAGH